MAGTPAGTEPLRCLWNYRHRSGREEPPLGATAVCCAVGSISREPHSIRRCLALPGAARLFPPARTRGLHVTPLRLYVPVHLSPGLKFILLYEELTRWS